MKQLSGWRSTVENLCEKFEDYMRVPAALGDLEVRNVHSG
jgi:hypothetical protein